MSPQFSPQLLGQFVSALNNTSSGDGCDLTRPHLSLADSLTSASPAPIVALARPQANHESSAMRATQQTDTRLETNPYPFWAARFWHGMPAQYWLPLIGRHALSIQPKALGLVGTVTFASLVNTAMQAMQRVLLDRRVARTKLIGAPVFIVGHWRSGTTLLHELMVLDEQFTSPSTYQCFAPNHFLVSHWWVSRLRFLLPSVRPMDNMLMGWSRPQEDEFALCNMGVKSPYLQLAFPRDRKEYAEYLDLSAMSAAELDHWKRTLHRFLQCVTYRTPKRIVLKSPPHLSRVRTLLEMFPDARFVHIVRDPLDVFSSTLKLWNTLYQSQSFQKPPADGYEEFIFDCFQRMYTQFEQDRELLSSRQLCEVRYEDLVRDPLGQMQTVYDQIELGDFSHVSPKVAAYFDASRDYRTNRHKLDAALRERVMRRWGPHMQRYGYCQQPLAAATEPAA